MRVVLIGSARERASLAERLPHDVVIAGEAQTVAAARAAGFDADGWLVAVHARDANDDSEDRADAGVEPLTPREVEVVELLANGLPNKTIAARLGISDQTVKFHVASICGKLGAANRTDAVRRALRRGLVAL